MLVCAFALPWLALPCCGFIIYYSFGLFIFCPSWEVFVLSFSFLGGSFPHFCFVLCLNKVFVNPSTVCAWVQSFRSVTKCPIKFEYVSWGGTRPKWWVKLLWDVSVHMHNMLFLCIIWTDVILFSLYFSDICSCDLSVNDLTQMSIICCIELDNTWPVVMSWKYCISTNTCFYEPLRLNVKTERENTKPSTHHHHHMSINSSLVCFWWIKDQSTLEFHLCEKTLTASFNFP